LVTSCTEGATEIYHVEIKFLSAQQQSNEFIEAVHLFAMWMECI
jgi:hypothetical protein